MKRITELYKKVLELYSRPDNALFVPWGGPRVGADAR